jgi:hypothetical protein
MRRGRQLSGQQPSYQGTVADVALHEDVTMIASERGQRIQITGIGEHVQVDDLQAVGCRLQHEIRTDETGSAGDEQGGGVIRWAVHCTFFGVIWANIRVRMVRPSRVSFEQISWPIWLLAEPTPSLPLIGGERLRGGWVAGAVSR